MNADTNNGDGSGERSVEGAASGTSHGATNYSRRTYLQGLLGAATGAAALKAVPTARASSWPGRFDRYFREFDNVVNVVDAGADPNGEESITPILREHRENDTLLAFPPGRYFMGSSFRFTGFDTFGLVGNDATIVPPDFHNTKNGNPRLFHLGIDYDPATRAVVDGFTVDQTAPDTGARVIEAYVNDGLEVRNITVEGVHDSGLWGPGRINIGDSDGYGIVENFRAPDGAQWTRDTPNAGNLWRGPTGLISNKNEGFLAYEDCELGPFPDNGLYAANGSGRIVVRGGRYVNSQAGNLRIGGRDAIIRDLEITIKNPPKHFSHMDGIRLANGGGHVIKNVTITNEADVANVRPITLDNEVENAKVTNPDIKIDAPGNNSGIVVHGGAGRLKLYDGKIQHDGPSDSGGYSVYLAGEGNDAGADIQNMKFVGNVGDSGGNSGIFNERDNVRIGPAVIYQPGGSDRTAVINRGKDCQIYKGAYRASGYPFIERGTGTWIEDVYAKSYNDYEAICLRTPCENLYLKDNTLRGGIRDAGSRSLSLENNRGV